MTALYVNSRSRKVMENGWHRAFIRDIDEEDSKFGPCYLIGFMIHSGHDGDFCNIYRQVYSSKSLFPGHNEYKPSKLYQIACAVLKRKLEEGEQIDLESLKGKTCEVLVNRGRGDTDYQIICDFRPISEEATEQGGFTE